MKNKKWLTLATAVILSAIALPVTAFAEKKDNTEENKLIEVTLNEVAHSIFYAPQYVAIEEGYFEEEGLDLTLVTGFGADKVLTALISGEADIGFMGAEASIYAYQEGATDPAVNFAQPTGREFPGCQRKNAGFQMGRSERRKSSWWTKGWRTYIHVNYETIVILCNWVDGMNTIFYFLLKRNKNI